MKCRNFATIGGGAMITCVSFRFGFGAVGSERDEFVEPGYLHQVQMSTHAHAHQWGDTVRSIKSVQTRQGETLSSIRRMSLSMRPSLVCLYLVQNVNTLTLLLKRQRCTAFYIRLCGWVRAWHACINVFVCVCKRIRIPFSHKAKFTKKRQNSKSNH